jgi:hypothetical protein
MRANLGSIRTTKDEGPINPLLRRITAKERHIEEIKADRFYSRKGDADWIKGIRKEIRTLKEEYQRNVAKLTLSH